MRHRETGRPIYGITYAQLREGRAYVAPVTRDRIFGGGVKLIGCPGSSPGAGKLDIEEVILEYIPGVDVPATVLLESTLPDEG